MSKAYLESQLAEQLDSDLTWRLRELSDLKSAISNSQKNARSVLLRSLVTMIYAHWEGHVRYCAIKYFEHVTIRKHLYNQLERQLYINAFLSRIDALYLSRASIVEGCRLVSQILDSSGDRFSYINPSLVDTRSNLSFAVVNDMCMICAIDSSYFEERQTFIDKILLKRRNAIAHGEELVVNSDDMDELIENGIGLMRAFKDLIQNKVYTKSYLLKSSLLA